VNPTQLPRTWHDLFRLNNWYEDLFVLIHDKLPKILVTVVIAIVLIRLLNIVSRRLARVNQSNLVTSSVRAQQLHTISSIIRSFGLTTIVFFAVVTVLFDLGIHVGPLLASAGIAGVAVGFGAQTLVHDVLNGFFILVENWFDVGDVIKIGVFQGSVEMLTLRRTVLRDADGSVHTIPNSTITAVTNMTRDWTQVAMHVAVDYKENSDRIIELLQQLGAEIRNDERFRDSIVADPLVPGIDRMTANEVDYLMLVKTRPGQQYAVSRELRRRIKDCFERNNIRPGGQNRFFVLDSSTPDSSAPAQR
jgi:small-conductance mechanosensitive channel